MMAAFAFGPKQGDTDLVQAVHTAQDERIVRRDDGVIDRVLGGEFHDTIKVRRLDGDAGGLACHAAVTRQGIDGLNGGVLSQGADDCVLAAAAADNQNIHIG